MINILYKTNKIYIFVYLLYIYLLIANVAKTETIRQKVIDQLLMYSDIKKNRRYYAVVF